MGGAAVLITLIPPGFVSPAAAGVHRAFIFYSVSDVNNLNGVNDVNKISIGANCLNPNLRN